MKAYLVEVSLLTRIVVPDSFDLKKYSEDGTGAAVINAAAQPKLLDKIRTDLVDNIAEVYLDTEVPYDPEYDGDRFCESCVHLTERITEESTNRFCRDCGQVLGVGDWIGCLKHKERG